MTEVAKTAAAEGLKVHFELDDNIEGIEIYWVGPENADGEPMYVCMAQVDRKKGLTIDVKDPTHAFVASEMEGAPGSDTPENGHLTSAPWFHDQLEKEKKMLISLAEDRKSIVITDQNKATTMRHIADYANETAAQRDSNSARIAILEAWVATNSALLLKNAGDIQDNKEDIEDNKSDIEDNKSDIDDYVSSSDSSEEEEDDMADKYCPGEEEEDTEYYERTYFVNKTSFKKYNLPWGPKGADAEQEPIDIYFFDENHDDDGKVIPQHYHQFACGEYDGTIDEEDIYSLNRRDIYSYKGERYIAKAHGAGVRTKIMHIQSNSKITITLTDDMFTEKIVKKKKQPDVARFYNETSFKNYTLFDDDDDHCQKLPALEVWDDYSFCRGLGPKLAEGAVCNYPGQRCFKKVNDELEEHFADQLVGEGKELGSCEGSTFVVKCYANKTKLALSCLEGINNFVITDEGCLMGKTLHKWEEDADWVEKTKYDDMWDTQEKEQFIRLDKNANNIKNNAKLIAQNAQTIGALKTQLSAMKQSHDELKAMFHHFVQAHAGAHQTIASMSAAISSKNDIHNTFNIYNVNSNNKAVANFVDDDDLAGKGKGKGKGKGNDGYATRG